MSSANIYSSGMSSKHSEIVLNNDFHESLDLKIDLQLGKAFVAKTWKGDLQRFKAELEGVWSDWE